MHPRTFRAGDLEALIDLTVRALIEGTLTAMRAAGCVVAWASTGGDDAHASVRAAYAAGGSTPLPTVFYSRVL